MSATKAKTPQQLARDAADRYFAALVYGIPFDVAEVDLTAEAHQILDAVRVRHPGRTRPGDDHAPLTAGYLLGVEIGRRIGGAR